jgi:flavodoxin
MNPKILLVYYSRSGNTRTLAGKLIETIGCDWVELRPEASFHKRITGYLKAVGHSILKKTPKLQSTGKKVANYELVIIGGPLWAGRIASPVRTFLRENRNQFKKVAFFVTQGGTSGGERVLRQMEMDAGTPPVASLVLSEKNLKEKHLKNALQGFLDQLKETLLKLKPPGVEAAKSGKTVSGGARKISASSSPETHR